MQRSVGRGEMSAGPTHRRRELQETTLPNLRLALEETERRPSPTSKAVRNAAAAARREGHPADPAETAAGQVCALRRSVWPRLARKIVC